MIEHFKNQGKLLRIPGRTSDEIYRVLQQALKAHFGWTKKVTDQDSDLQQHQTLKEGRC